MTDTPQSEISYTRKPSRGRSIRLTVRPGGEVVVSAPVRVPELLIRQFIRRKIRWVRGKVEKMRGVRPYDAAEARRQYLQHRDRARELVMRRLPELNRAYGFRYGRVSIKNHKSLWGSCSRKGNLNFSYKLALISPEQADYIMVHELCHLREFNHSPRFWALVARAVPSYKSLKAQLRAHGVSVS